MLALRHVTERPVRTLITILGVALGVSVSVAIRTANVEVLRSFEAAVNSVAGRASLQASSGDLGFDERVIVPVRRHSDVTSATPVISIVATVAAGPHEGKVLHVVGLDLLEAAGLKDFELDVTDESDPLLESLLAPNALFMGVERASEWGLLPGHSLELNVGMKQYEVVVHGLVKPANEPASAWDRLAVMDIAAAQQLFGLVGRLDRIDIVTRPGRPVEDIAGELRQLVPPSLVISRPSRRNEQVEHMIRAFQLNLTTLSAVGLLVGLLLVYNTVSFSVVQRRREIGIFRAVGMGRSSVITLFMIEGAAMGIMGGVLGGWLGAGFSEQLVTILKRNVSELYVPVPTLGTGSQLNVTMLLLESALLGGIVSILGAMGPSLEASRTQPARALAPGQYEEEQQVRAGRLALIGCGFFALALVLALPGPVAGLPLFGYASALCLLLGLSCMAPALLIGLGRVFGSGWRLAAKIPRGTALSHLAADQLARTPGRNAVTISALMVGIAIMIGVGIMIQSFRGTVENWIEQTIIADLILAPPSWPTGAEEASPAHRIPLRLAEEVATVPGVAAVDTYRHMTIELEGRPVGLVARDLLVHAQWSRYLFLSGDSSSTLRKTVDEKGVILSEALARRLGLEAQDRLTLATPLGPRTFPVMGVFYDYATDGGKVVMDRGLFHKLWQDETTTVIPLYLSPDAEAEAVEERIEKVVGREGRFAVIRNADIKREILAIFDRTFTVTYALQIITVVIALLGIANTVLTSVLERQREIGTLRAIGASRAQVRWLVLWETLYLGLLGAMMGILGGILLSLLLIEVINRQSFGWTIRFVLPLDLLGQAILLALGAALAAGYLPAAWAAKQPIADGLRYE